MDWHQRYQQQSEWTASVRQYLAGRAGLDRMERILEAGCGTGAITRSLHALTDAAIFGIDFNTAYLQTARQFDPSTQFCGGDARQMPYPDRIFDAVVCHFFLLWVPEPLQALREMVRATRPGGAVIAFAEPDYGGRIDYPQPLEKLGQWQADALRSQGADPQMGRQLSSLFHAASLKTIEVGVLGGQWQESRSLEQYTSEWAVLQSDLDGIVPSHTLDRLREVDEAAWKSGERVLFVPTFYAIGWKPT